MTEQPTDVLSFWFDEIDPKMHWRKDPTFDQQIARRFKTVYALAAAGELAHWRSDSPGRLAEILLLDQFPRNMFRSTNAAFATDALALELAQAAVRGQHDRELPQAQRKFFYMPFMHSESIAVHDDARALFDALGDQATSSSAARHYAVLKQFGRYPHRNSILGRRSTLAEQAFLAQPGSHF